jgi:hypothetical protein
LFENKHLVLVTSFLLLQGIKFKRFGISKLYFFFCGLERSRSGKRKASELWQKFSGLEHLEDNNDKNAALKIILVVVPLKSPHTPRQKAASMKGT